RILPPAGCIPRLRRLRLDDHGPGAVRADGHIRHSAIGDCLYTQKQRADGMEAYLDLMRDVRDNGVDKADRTGVGTRSVFGRQIRFDLAAGFPAVTTKKLHLRSIIHELLWFIAGDTNIGYLKANGVSIWDQWADANGDLGPVYGYQWRS